MQTVQKPTNKFSVKPFSKGLAASRRWQNRICTQKTDTILLAGKEIIHSVCIIALMPADCFWKRGILRDHAPYFRLKQKFPRRSKAAQ